MREGREFFIEFFSNLLNIKSAYTFRGLSLLFTIFSRFFGIFSLFTSTTRLFGNTSLLSAISDESMRDHFRQLFRLSGLYFQSACASLLYEESFAMI